MTIKYYISVMLRKTFLAVACLLPGLALAAQEPQGVQKKHLSWYDTFFGNEQDYQVCYPKDHRSVFVTIIVLSVLAVIMLGLIIYYKTKNNKLLKVTNDTIQQKNQEVRDSILYARRIQHALLPDAELLDKLDVSCRVIYHPRDIVSGDFYWAYEDERNMYFAVIDCTGHGVPGAFLSLLAHNAINKAVIEMGIEVADEVLHTMNRYVKDVLKQQSSQELKDGMEVGLCIVNKQSRRVSYAGAGINLHYASGQDLCEVKAAKCSVGSVEQHVKQIPETHSLNLPKGTRLYMHSDGIVDQFGGEKIKKFSTKRLKELIASTLPMGLAEQAQSIEQAFVKWKGGQEQTDDVLFLTIEL